MESRREFIRKSILFSGGAGLATVMPASIQRALAIDPDPGSTYLDAEHVVILMQENRSFDHTLGSLSGVRGFNDPRVVTLPDQNPVWFQTDHLGKTYAPFRLNLMGSKVTWIGSLPHSRASQVDAFNGGKYDQWLTSKRSGNKKYADMPLTLGYYSREDLPFHYSLADAFTVCDQNFCSGMTSTTPNRSFFWTGKITQELDGLQKVNIRNDDYAYGKHTWKTFPELLEENKVAWKFYQNETSCGGGFAGKERSWLSNFGCNLLEFFEAYHVKFKDSYLDNLRKQVEKLPGEIGKLEEASPSSSEESARIRESLRNKQEALNKAEQELKMYSAEQYNKLSAFEKSLNQRAFVTNKEDTDFRSLEKLTFNESGKLREVEVPKGDILHQFRADVKAGKLPAVSWLAGPQNFSDHPSAPWYGAWYVSEILDILTQNPEVWKKTIFIITYDENDGYYDHIPPFSIPDNNKPETGKCSAGIDTEVEHVRLENELKQGIPKKQAREAPVGLGFRVPMYIVSPWSRGGKVCSQVFDHTSSLQFLEKFINAKYNKSIHLDNISAWRRTICGDLTSAFTPFESAKDQLPFLNRNQYIENIYNAQFKEDPSGFEELTKAEIKAVQQKHTISKFNRLQEKGQRRSAALPYQYDVFGKVDGGQFIMHMEVSTTIFGARTAGVPLTVYAPGKYIQSKGEQTEICRNWNFAVKANDRLEYQWPVTSFEDNKYALRVHGPNGFYRAFSGESSDPQLLVKIIPEQKSMTKAATGNAVVLIENQGKNPLRIHLVSKSYKDVNIEREIAGKTEVQVSLDLSSSGSWYDLKLTLPDYKNFERHMAGRIESGNETVTDPLLS
ncbi:phosphocholine-specific phospholipase C [Sphingobacterium spiritivorum]|uniref:phosphocholine-specific phospholipase C n=1 Tax=Sphingobacterium spiritivorum TaxID=258 RepID=UPI003DA56BA8